MKIAEPKPKRFRLIVRDERTDKSRSTLLEVDDKTDLGQAFKTVVSALKTILSK